MIQTPTHEQRRAAATSSGERSDEVALMATSRSTAAMSLIYGTAWKKDQTRTLVHQAILAGFRAIDTAAQPKHYQEHLVGSGIRDAIKEGCVKREDLYIQTKFTAIHGQDPQNMPYAPQASITDQVTASIKSSLYNLRVDEHADSESYLDCLVLHSPFPSFEQTKEAWRAMEAHVPHSVRALGISNIYHLPALKALYEFAIIRPFVVQNRFYADTGYDADIRAFCAEKDITYQAFWTLTANPHLMASKPVEAVVKGAGVGDAVALYGLVLDLGRISVLNGTKNAERMKDDLEGVRKVQAWTTEKPDEWKSVRGDFVELLRVE